MKHSWNNFPNVNQIHRTPQSVAHDEAVAERSSGLAIVTRITHCGCFTASGINTLYWAYTIAELDWCTGLGFSLIEDGTAVYIQTVNITKATQATSLFLLPSLQRHCSSSSQSEKSCAFHI